ncbi:MAG: ABC transporter ATP-binding protein [Saprospiraceae bacterium]
MEVLRIDQLNKKYGAIHAVKNLNLSIQKGEIFGLLGPNGSGKTTTLGMVLGITKQNSGSFSWFGEGSTATNRKNIGALLETPNFYPYLNADKNLEIIAHIKRVKTPNFDDLLDLVNLKHRRKSKFKTYSLGMKQRLAIAAALVGNPEVLIFDEPTNGLDPQGIAEVRETIIKIAERGKTIIMASHILDEVEKVCSHVAIIKNGSLLATGTVGSIMNSDLQVEIAASDNEALKSLLGQLPEIKHLQEVRDKLILEVNNSFSTSKLNQFAFDNGIVLTHLAAKSKSLEEEFLEITQNN